MTPYTVQRDPSGRGYRIVDDQGAATRCGCKYYGPAKNAADVMTRLLLEDGELPAKDTTTANWTPEEEAL